MEFYRDNKSVIQWFNAEMSKYMETYYEVGSATCVLVEKYNCDILTTSRIYTNKINGDKMLLPPNAWSSPLVAWNVDRNDTTYETNACNMYAFNTFRDLVNYLQMVHALQHSIPFFNINARMETERLERLIDADYEPPPPKRSKRTKVYISN